jgi:predicted nucleotide-binding protein
MVKNLIEKLRQFIDQISDIKDLDGYETWRTRVFEFLKIAQDKNSADKFWQISIPEKEWTISSMGAMGHIEGILTKVETDVNSSEMEIYTKEIKKTHSQEKIFIVHGHDNETKETVARFLQKIGLTPIILYEQPNLGRTIIEKFETFADVSYAVVLLTPDDVGAVAGNERDLKKRARQNVIMELGYFIGKLGRNRVCALNKEGIEIPSDYHGIVYINIDSKGGWKTKLAQEFVQAGLSIKLEGLLG